MSRKILSSPGLSSQMGIDYHSFAKHGLDLYCAINMDTVYGWIGIRCEY